MRCLTRLLLVFIVLTFPVITADESKEELGSVCDESVHYGNLQISIAEVYERIAYRTWPEVPPIYRFARITGAYAVFQIKVSTSGEVCFIESIGGNPVIVQPLMLEIKKWRFLPLKPFWGVIAVKYSSSEGFQLLLSEVPMDELLKKVFELDIQMLEKWTPHR